MADLRDGETRDDDMGHAARNAAQLRMAQDDRTTKQSDNNSDNKTMTAQVTHWLTYGEPIDNEHVEATKIIAYQTGPNESRDDEIIEGTIPMDLLDLIEGHEHQHEDGSLMLSALDADERDRIEGAFRELATDGGQNTWTKSDVRVRYDLGAWLARVHLMTMQIRYGHEEAVGEKTIGQYAFVDLRKEGIADRIRGDLDIDGPTAIYVGDRLGSHYHRSHDIDNVPVDVLEALRDEGVALLDNVEGGWADWDGRPEWSETFLDVTEAEPIDLDEIIADRREADQ